MKTIRKILNAILGKPRYLKLVSWWYLVSFRKGWLKKNPAYRTHYFVRNLIKKGNVVIDIGANLGYYTTEFARLTGTSGRVIAVEPIPLYRRVLKFNTRELTQVEIQPYALGATEGLVYMGLPGTEAHRHGLMKVLKKEEQLQARELYEVKIRKPEQLFGDLPIVHYIKCDIEGYEIPVIPEMSGMITKFRPILQVETDGQHKITLHHLFTSWNYRCFYVGENGLVPYDDPSELLPGDMVAIPAEHAVLKRKELISVGS